MMLEESFYLDQDGLKRLFAQIDGNSISKLSVSENNTSATNTVAKIDSKTGGLTLFGITLGLAGDRSFNRQQARITTSEKIAEPESQAIAIKAALKSCGRLYKDPYAAVNAAKASGRSSFCEFFGDFYPVGWVSSENNEAVNIAVKSGYLQMYHADDSKFLIGMSMAKICGNYKDGVGLTSHLAIRLRNSPMSLHILGCIDRSKYVKPFIVTLR